MMAGVPAEGAFIVVKDAALPTVNVYFAYG